jgi:hypothetical protein
MKLTDLWAGIVETFGYISSDYFRLILPSIDGHLRRSTHA